MTEVVDGTYVKVVVFQLADKEYVIPVSQVQGIEKLIHITRVPKTPSFVKGVINLRGSSYSDYRFEKSFWARRKFA